MLLLILAALVALLVSFLCSLMEATLLSLTPAQAAELSERHATAGAVWREFKADIERPIAVILILNTSAHTIGAAVAGAQVDKVFQGRGVLLFSVVFTFLMLQFTEILPKTLGVRHNRRLAFLFAVPLQWAVRLMTPVLNAVRWLNRPFGGRREESGAVALEEIAALAAVARVANLLSSHQERIIQGASRLSRTPVRRAMIPADQISFLSADQSLMDAIIAAHLDPHTRFPVCEEKDRDRVVGYVNFKELIYYMRTNPRDPSPRGIVRPIHFASPDESAADLLRVFVEQHVHIAIVRDEAGKTVGLATFEDIVEQLVGPLEDEFDQLPRMFHALSGGTWMVGGGVPVSELAREMGVVLPDAEGAVSAWLVRRMGRLPKLNEVHREGETEFLIRRLRRGKVFEASVARAGSPHPGAPPPRRDAN